MLPLAVLCGGLGTRMRPHTLALPKPMIAVNGEPFLAHFLRNVAAHGVEDVVLLIGYRGEAIADFVGDGAPFGVQVRYSWDGDAPLGTAGAVRSALPLLGERFFVTFGDAFLRVDYRAVVASFERSRCRGLMTVCRPWSDRVAPNTGVAGERVVRYDKQATSPDVQYVDFGLSVFSAGAFAVVASDGPHDLSVVNTNLIGRGELAAFHVAEPPFEIGSPEGLEATESYIRSRP